MKKFKLTDEKIQHLGKTLYRIQALRDFADVKTGDLGGFVEKEENLSQEGDCWIYDEARVYDNAQVFGNAKVYDYARVFGNAWVYGNAQVYDEARVYDNAWVYGDSLASGNAWVYGDSLASGNAQVVDNACVYGDAWVCGNARVYGDAEVYSNKDYCVFQGFGSENRSTTFYRTKNGGIGVTSGCFTGTIEEFVKQVEKTHGGKKFGREYKAIIEVVKIKFENKK